MNITIPVSAGELVDKISILYIKSQNISDSTKLEKINFELKLLNEYLSNISTSLSDDKLIYLEYLYNELLTVNNKLWKVEDALRELERDKVFDSTFVENARSVYVLNDARFNVKNNVNLLFNSDVQEVKSYEKY